MLIGAGLGLFVAPGAVDDLWPWALSELTARAVAAWLLGLGTLAGLAAVDADPRRSAIGVAMIGAFGVLQAVALGLYDGGVDWSGPRAWIYLAVLASMAASAALTLARIPRTRRDARGGALTRGPAPRAAPPA